MRPFAVVCVLVVGGAVAASSGMSASMPAGSSSIEHVLNRIAFGPRPGDVERIQSMGPKSSGAPGDIDKFVKAQLHPESISDSAAEARLESLDTLRMNLRDLADQFQQDRAQTVLTQLAEQKVLRAVYSERQLQEVLVDFWFNHFNVDARKGPDRFMLTAYEREVIRPHVLGKFRDLLEATAKSPAMLFYLDNWMSVDPAGPHPIVRPPHVARGPFGGPVFVPGSVRPAPAGKNAPKGLNENYGRELMELHTLGVDGDYTQRDVTEVARAFTGWTIDRPRQGGGFKFDPRLHDNGQKVVLGQVIPAGGGESDGEKVLDILSKHPSTARFISTELVRRFVSDTPPPGLVARTAETFRRTDGDLRRVMETILLSPEFQAPDAMNAKAKTPFEFVVSALRSTGADIQDAQPIVKAMQQLGMPLYQCQPPTGYKDTADAWINTGALVERMNFAVRLAGNKLPGVTLGDDIATGNELALKLGAPDFQRR